MRRGAAKNNPGHILDVVIELLSSKGYDGWQLRDVADGARASLSTIYNFYPSRDELIVSAVEKWMAENAYQSLLPPEPGTPPLDALIRLFHAIFEPWERNPEMLDVFVRAGQTEGGGRLNTQGVGATAALGELFADLDPGFAADLALILPTIVYGALARYTRRDIAVTDILKIIESTLRWLQWPSASPASRRGLRNRSVLRQTS